MPLTASHRDKPLVPNLQLHNLKRRHRSRGLWNLRLGTVGEEPSRRGKAGAAFHRIAEAPEAKSVPLPRATKAPLRLIPTPFQCRGWWPLAGLGKKLSTSEWQGFSDRECLRTGSALTTNHSYNNILPVSTYKQVCSSA